MGIFSDVEDYTVDRLQEIALELYNNAYRDYIDHGVPEQVQLMAEWSAIAAFRRKMNIKGHRVSVPRSLLPVELLNKKRELDELRNAFDVPVIAPRRARLPKNNVQRILWAQAVPEPVANPFINVMVDDPF